MEPDIQDEFEFEPVVAPALGAPPAPASLSEMEAMMKRLLEPLQDKVKALEV
jgi:hypothetical protein